jgi:hypothetical protein
MMSKVISILPFRLFRKGFFYVLRPNGFYLFF